MLPRETVKADTVAGADLQAVNDLAGELVDGSNNPTTDSAQAPAFNYANLDDLAADFARTTAVEIRKDVRKLQHGILEVGNKLIAVKDAIGHGHFGSWIAAEFKMSADTAGRFMNVARRLGHIPHVAEFEPSVLYAMAAPSTPDHVIREVVERHAAGAAVTRDDVAALKALALNPEGRRAIKQVAKAVRAEDLKERHVERQHDLEKIAEKNPDLPVGRLFSFVLIDVPRHHNVYADDTGSEKAPENHYPTMTFSELCNFPIDSFAAPDAVIAYWSTAASLLDDLDILAEWRFVTFRPRNPVDGKLIYNDGEPTPAHGAGRYGSYQIWRKRRAGKRTGMGRWFRDQHEMLILARRGNVDAPLPGTQDESVFDADIGAHSEKPHDHVRAWIDRCWPHLNKVEIFARGIEPPGWVFWGNQVLDRAPRTVAVQQ
jgi:N6-adenosine-specific RNA methylase IME4